MVVSWMTEEKTPLTDITVLQNTIQLHINQIEILQKSKNEYQEKIDNINEEQSTLNKQLDLLCKYHTFVTNHGFKTLNELL